MEEETPAQQPAKRSEQSDFWRFTAELVKTALIVSVLAYLIRLFILQPFIVEGSSMYPQFRTNDYLLVDKVSYRFETPARGDIVVFRYPNDESINYVKRVIGLPGETIKIAEGEVIVANEANPKGFVIDESYVSPSNPTTLPGNVPTGEFTVPADSYFVMGDNRQASSDSREWGFLPKRDLIGRVVLQAYPLDRLGFISHARYDK